MKNLCNAVMYENKTNPGVRYAECGFWRYIEQRKIALSEQEDIRILHTIRACPTPINLFLCLIRKTFVYDDRPVAPKGEYRVNNFWEKG